MLPLGTRFAIGCSLFKDAIPHAIYLFILAQQTWTEQDKKTAGQITLLFHFLSVLQFCTALLVRFIHRRYFVSVTVDREPL